jgi:hypothetical protein
LNELKSSCHLILKYERILAPSIHVRAGSVNKKMEVHYPPNQPSKALLFLSWFPTPQVEDIRMISKVSVHHNHTVNLPVLQRQIVQDNYFKWSRCCITSYNSQTNSCRKMTEKLRTCVDVWRAQTWIHLSYDGFVST